MLPSSNVVKDTAKTVLNDKKVVAFGASAIFGTAVFFIYVLNSVFGYVFNTFGGLVSAFATLLFLFMPLFLGFLRFLKNIAFGCEGNVTEMFYYFANGKEYIRALEFNLFLFVRAFLLSIVFFLPAIVASLLTNNSFYTFFHSSMPFWASGLKVVSNILKLAGIVALLLSLLKYYIAPCMFVSNDNMEAEKIIELSAVVSKSTKSDFLWLILSLAVWILLTLLAVPMPFTLPFVTMCYIVHSRFAVAKYNFTVNHAE